MITLSAIALQLKRDSGLPLFVQISDQIRQRIVSAEIEHNTCLPPSRSLAAELGVSRSTVVTAYDQLVAEGYIEGRRGAGFFVCQLGETDPLGPAGEIKRQARPLSAEVESAAIRHHGFPDNRLFPYRAWARCLARSARLTPEALIRSTSSFGDEALRQSIARYLLDWRGLDVAPEQVVITAGSIDALETCIRTLFRPGDRIGLENPGYLPLRNIVINQGMQVEWLAVGSRGAELPRSTRAKTTARCVILTPSHQFPLGGAMPPDRRLEFQQWASDAEAWIIEDDYDSEFRYAGRPIPALASMDTSGRTIYIGTFSKVFSVGLRLGYLILPPHLLADFANTQARFGIKAALPCQRALANFIDAGDFYRHIRRVRRIYGERRKTLLEQIQQHLSSFVTYEDHQAGMQIAVKLVPGLDDQDIARLAAQQGTPVAPLSPHYGGNQSENGLLLGFCPYTEAEIRFEIESLGRIIQSLAG